MVNAQQLAMSHVFFHSSTGGIYFTGGKHFMHALLSVQKVSIHNHGALQKWTEMVDMLVAIGIIVLPDVQEWMVRE